MLYYWLELLWVKRNKISISKVYNYFKNRYGAIRNIKKLGE